MAPEPEHDEHERLQPMARFTGTGAAALGIDRERIGEADPRLENLFNGKSPDGTVQLRAMYDRERTDHRTGKKETLKARPFYDIGANAPKDISVLYATGSDSDRAKILAAHQAATQSVIGILSDRATTRVNAQGTNTEKVKPLFAVIDHDTNRNNEPHLHSHILMFNGGQRQNGKWGALDVTPLFSSHHELGAVYNQDLEREFNQRFHNTTERYKLEKGESFRVVDVPEKVREGFATRSADIKSAREKLEERGITINSKVVQIAVLDTREVADRGRDKAAVRSQWGQKAVELEFDGRSFLKPQEKLKEKQRVVTGGKPEREPDKVAPIRAPSSLHQNLFKEIDRQGEAVAHSYGKRLREEQRAAVSVVGYRAPQKRQANYARGSKLVEPVLHSIDQTSEKNAEAQRRAQRVQQLSRMQFQRSKIQTGQSVAFGKEVVPSKVINSQLAKSQSARGVGSSSIGRSGGKAAKVYDFLQNVRDFQKKATGADRWEAKKVAVKTQEPATLMGNGEKLRGQVVAKNAEKQIATGQPPHTAPGAPTVGEKTVRLVPGGNLAADKVLKAKYGEQQVQFRKVSSTARHSDPAKTVSVQLPNSSVKREMSPQAANKEKAYSRGR